MTVHSRLATTLAAGALAAVPLTAAAQTNLLSNPGFEQDTIGETASTPPDAILEGEPANDWRFFGVGGVDTSATIVGTASEGSNAVQLVRNTPGGDSGFDRGGFFVGVQPGSVLVTRADLRDGTVNGGTNSASLDIFTISSTNSADQNTQRILVDPSATAYEEFSTSSVTRGGQDSAGTSFRTNAAPSSLLIDNVRLFDATFGGNRVANPGAENSDTRVIQFGVNPVAGNSVTLDTSDPRSGDNAFLFTNSTTPVGDSVAGLSRGSVDSRVAVLGSEEIEVGFSVKKVSGGDNIALQLLTAEFNEFGQFVGRTLLRDSSGIVIVNASPMVGDDYQDILLEGLTNATASRIDLEFRIIDLNNNGAQAAGSFLIDDIFVRGIPEPASLVLLGVGALALTGRRRA